MRSFTWYFIHKSSSSSHFFFVTTETFGCFWSLGRDLIKNIHSLIGHRHVASKEPSTLGAGHHPHCAFGSFQFDSWCGHVRTYINVPLDFVSRGHSAHTHTTGSSIMLEEKRRFFYFLKLVFRQTVLLENARLVFNYFILRAGTASTHCNYQSRTFCIGIDLILYFSFDWW